MDFVKSLHAITTLFHGTLDNFEVESKHPCHKLIFALKATSSLVPNGCFKVVKSYIIESSEVTWQSNREFPGPFSTDTFPTETMIDEFPCLLFHYFLFIMNILPFIMNFKITLISKVTDAILIVIIGRWLGPTYLLCCRLLFSSKATVVLCWICLGAKEVQKLKKKNLLVALGSS